MSTISKAYNQEAATIDLLRKEELRRAVAEAEAERRAVEQRKVRSIEASRQADQRLQAANSFVGQTLIPRLDGEVTFFASIGVRWVRDEGFPTISFVTGHDRVLARVIVEGGGGARFSPRKRGAERTSASGLDEELAEEIMAYVGRNLARTLSVDEVASE